jgi:hypothetical protein
MRTCTQGPRYALYQERMIHWSFQRLPAHASSGEHLCYVEAQNEELEEMVASIIPDLERLSKEAAMESVFHLKRTVTDLNSGKRPLVCQTTKYKYYRQYCLGSNYYKNTEHTFARRRAPYKKVAERVDTSYQLLAGAQNAFVEAVLHWKIQGPSDDHHGCLSVYHLNHEATVTLNPFPTDAELRQWVGMANTPRTTLADRIEDSSHAISYCVELHTVEELSLEVSATAYLEFDPNIGPNQGTYWKQAWMEAQDAVEGKVFDESQPGVCRAIVCELAR